MRHRHQMRLYFYILFTLNIERLLFLQLATAPYLWMLSWESVFIAAVIGRQGPLSLLPVPCWTVPVPMIARSSQSEEVPPDSSDTYVATTRPFERWYSIAVGRDEKNLQLRASRHIKDELYANESAGFASMQASRIYCRRSEQCDFFQNVEDEFGSI